MDLRKVYEYALQREREGYQFFKSHAARTGHAAAKSIFEKLAGEEQTHVLYLESLLAWLDDVKEEGDAPPETDLSFFSQRAIDELLEQTLIESMLPEASALRVAYLIEKDFAEFYERMADQAEGGAQEALRRLARWERGHEVLFKSLHDRIYEEYMNMPWGG